MIPPCLPDRAPAPDAIYSNLTGPVVQIDGACFSKAVPVPAILDEDNILVVSAGTEHVDCAVVECGPVGLYCYTSVEAPQTGILAFQPLHFPAPLVVLDNDNITRCYNNPAFVKQVFENYGTYTNSNSAKTAWGSYALPVTPSQCGVAFNYTSCNGNDELIVVNGGASTVLYNGRCWTNPQAVVDFGTLIPIVAGTDVVPVSGCFDAACTGSHFGGMSYIYADQQNGQPVNVQFEHLDTGVPYFGVAPEKIDDGANGLTDGQASITFADGNPRQTITTVPGTGRLELLVSLKGFRKRIIRTRSGADAVITRLPAADNNRVFLDVVTGDTFSIEIDDNRPNPSRTNIYAHGYATWKATPLSLRRYDSAILSYVGSTAIKAVAFTGIGDRVPAAYYTVPSALSTLYPNPDTYLTVQGQGSAEYILVNSATSGDQVPIGPANTVLYAGQSLTGPLTFRFYTGRGAAGAHGEMDVWLSTDGTLPPLFAAGPYRALVRPQTAVPQASTIGDTHRSVLEVAVPGVDYVLPSFYVSDAGKRIVVSGPSLNSIVQNGTEYDLAGTAFGLAFNISQP